MTCLKRLVCLLCIPCLAAMYTPAQAEVSNLSLNAQLLLASRQADAAQVKRLLGLGAAADSRNRLGKTALLMACERGDVALAELLLDRGASAAIASVAGVTPLMAASTASRCGDEA